MIANDSASMRPRARRSRSWSGVVALVVAIVVSLGFHRRAEGADTWSDPHPGMRRLLRTAPGPLRIHALVVDLCAPGVEVRATAPNENQQTTSSFAQSVGAQAAINGDFFSYSNYYPISMAVGNGQDWGMSDPDWRAFVAFGDHRAHFSPESETYGDPEPWMEEVVSGHAQIVADGQPITSYDCSGHFCNTEPRTAVGFSKDRKTLILMVIDGRSSSSVGATLAQLAEQMHSLGAYDAVNLDGGGSSAMWVEAVGVVNVPSDGTERVVANHLAVFASGSGQPAHCVNDPEEEASVYGPLWDGSSSTDVDGDGMADVCARGYGGLFCRLATGTGFPEEWSTAPELGDELGWGDPSNYSTVRLADLTGDGMADLCARGDSGLICFESTGSGFDTAAIGGPSWSDGAGWDAVKHYSTIRFADLDGDRRADICGRGPDGVVCHLSEGGGFGPPIAGPAHADSVGWGAAQHYSTYRVGDVDGDGRDDMCARASAGVRCYLSASSPLADFIDGPEWSDANGWSHPKHYSTIRLGDIDGDGRDDLCGRTPDGVECHPSVGDGFASPVPGPPLTDDTGWADPTNYLTIRVGDIDGDGRDDMCARADSSMWCWLSEGSGFSPHIDGPAWSDAAGWFQAKHYDTIRLSDVNGDGLDDLCGRGPDGVSCHLSDGNGFPDEIQGPGWADSVGWGSARYYTTLRAETPPPPGETTPDGGVPTDDGGAEGDGGHPSQDGSTTTDASGEPHSDGSAEQPPNTTSSGCSCSAADGPGSDRTAGGLCLLLLLSLVGGGLAIKRSNPRGRIAGA